MELSANTREILGKKVRFLRRQGITPAHLFGHNVKPVPLQCDTAELKHVLARTGTTGLISLKLDKAKRPRNVMTGLIGLKLDKARKPRNVVVREVQREPLTGELLHVDFYQVRMEEKIRVEVPIVPIGEAPALRLKENFLAHELNSLTIECLPDEIPNRVELDLSSLAEAEQAIHVEDISLADGITVLNNPEQLVMKISAGFVEKAIEEEEAEAPKGITVSEEEPKEESSSAVKRRQ
ncbi:50S ribosomal protein L25 [subsurface metagenome]